MMENRNSLTMSCIAAILLILLPAHNLNAGSHQDHKSIYDAAVYHVKQRLSGKYGAALKVSSDRIDSRLKLTKCTVPLEASVPEYGNRLGRTTVGIHCASPKPWSLRVQVNVSAFKDVVVTTRDMNRGHVLAPDDLRYKRVDIARHPHGYLLDFEDAAGKKLKRRLRQESVLRPSMLSSPNLIRRGQNVTIIAESATMQVRMKGKALSNGAAGERLRVENVSSGRKLEGIVTAAGEVKIEL